MIYWISKLLKIAEKGLEKRDFMGKSGTNETKYLEHLNKIINNKETVDSHVINKFSKFQNLQTTICYCSYGRVAKFIPKNVYVFVQANLKQTFVTLFCVSC